MNLESNLYPYDPNVWQLPFYLTGIGGTHYHNGLERKEGYHWNQIIHTISGEGILILGDESFELKPGSYLFLPKQFPHTYWANSNNPWEVNWFSFETQSEATLSALHFDKPLIINSETGSFQPLEQIFEAMYTSQKNDVLYCNFECSHYVYQYLIEYYRYLNLEYDSERSKMFRVLKPALNYIYEHYMEDINIEELAKCSGVSVQHLCRVFQKAFHVRPIEYLTHKRIDEAKQLLLESDYPISKIGNMVGFHDASYFTMTFKKIEGITPSEYQKRIRE